ncbi:MAG: glycosyltransferase family 4 protein [Candidatus Moranbacteria bacterium]|nr:glycosyltransferase family 4 protein [Candidatus Moranbacteria bacterium]
MRIGIDIRCLAEGRRTGVEEYTLGLLKELLHSEGGHHFVLFFNSWSKPPRFLHALAHHDNVTIKAYRLPNKLLNFCLWYLRYPKLDRLMGGVDVVFLPNQNFAATSKHVPLVVTAHDLSFELFPRTFSWKQRIWHYLVDFRGLIKRSRVVVAVSDSTKNDVVDTYGTKEAKITVIPSGYDKNCRLIDRNSEVLIDVQKRYKLPFKFILSFATFEPRKNLLSVIEAYEEFIKQNPDSQYDLVLAGSPGWEKRALYTRIRTSALRSRIHTIGFVEDADKPAVYNLASVFVYPSFYEGFGFPPLEAMACGVPVIASHSSSLPEIVGDAGILIDPYRPQEIFDAFEAILKDRELHETLRARGLERCVRYSWARTSSEVLGLFGKL